MVKLIIISIYKYVVQGIRLSHSLNFYKIAGAQKTIAVTSIVIIYVRERYGREEILWRLRPMGINLVALS